jgi:ABC-type ATPase with predicted acetyltransferase domain
LKRISVYLDEDEVSEQVSTLKKTTTNDTESDKDIGFGIINASFKWNAVEKQEEDVKLDQGKSTNSSRESSPSSETAASDVVSSLVDEDHMFELRDIDVMFPEGELTIVTGPTASGKTALLVRFPHHFSS